MKTLKIYLIALLFFPITVFSQSDFDRVLKAGEVLLNGFTIFKAGKADAQKESKTIESVCIKNRLADKITFILTGESNDGDKIKKELVIQLDTKECILQLPKGVYTYEIILPNKEVYKKGDYKFEEDTVITVKKEN